MTDPYMSEIRICAFNFAPKGWAMCNGQLLPIAQNQALFSLLGTYFGGNGQVTFGLPNLQGRTPIHTGQGHILAESGGEQAHTLSISELPQHTHTLSASALNANSATGSGEVLGAVTDVYHSPENGVSLNPASVTNVGGSQPHNNMQPYLTLNFCIAMVGIFPTQN
jgi:microcystin-dependent protein